MARKAKTTTLTEQDVALMSVGGAVEISATSATSTEVAEEVTEASTPAEVELEAVVISADPSIVEFLKTELASAQDKLATAKIENAQLQTKFDTMTSCHSQFRQVVQDVAGIRTSALGHRPLSLESLSDEVLLQEYTNITTEFHAAYPVGGKAILPSTEAPERPELATGISKQALKASKI